mgnify:CR=1 FL=1
MMEEILSRYENLSEQKGGAKNHSLKAHNEKYVKCAKILFKRIQYEKRQ